VTIDECTALSKAVSRQLDELDLIPFRYRLEVSSPGITRPFRHRVQYAWNVGHRVKVSLHEPLADRRSIEGTLDAVGDDLLVVRTDDGSAIEVPFDRIREVCRVVVF